MVDRHGGYLFGISQVAVHAELGCNLAHHAGLGVVECSKPDIFASQISKNLKSSWKLPSTFETICIFRSTTKADFHPPNIFVMCQVFVSEKVEGFDLDHEA